MLFVVYSSKKTVLPQFVRICDPSPTRTITILPAPKGAATPLIPDTTAAASANTKPIIFLIFIPITLSQRSLNPVLKVKLHLFPRHKFVTTLNSPLHPRYCCPVHEETRLN